MTWRQRRKLAYLMHDKFNDSNLPYTVLEMTDAQIKDMVIDFFRNGSELIYPAKSYFVALIYARLLHEHFGIPFLEALDTDDLLPDDPAFVPYREKTDLYTSILRELPDKFWLLPSAAATVNYFKEEFLIGTYC